VDSRPDTDVSEEDFRGLMSMICGPVVIVTTMSCGEPAGTTVSAFASLSLRPRLVMFALDRQSRLLDKVEDTGRFGVNVLQFAQAELATTFATKRDDKFAGIEWSTRDGLPYLAGSPGWAVGSVHELVPGGDHIIVIGRIHDIASQTAAPLIYGGRTFGTHSHLPGRH